MTSPGFKSVRPSPRFQRDYKKLDPQLKKAVDECIRDLMREVIPDARRWHALQNTTPRIFKADVLPNHSYQVTAHIDPSDGALVLRRVATHARIDDNP